MPTATSWFLPMKVPTSWSCPWIRRCQSATSVPTRFKWIYIRAEESRRGGHRGSPRLCLSGDIPAHYPTATTSSMGNMPGDLSSSDLDELVARYASAAKLAGQLDDIRAQNRAADELSLIHAELRSRGDGALDKLLPLVESSDRSVRLWAASHTLPDERAELVLESIAAGPGLDAVTAKYTLIEWRAGRLRHLDGPTRMGDRGERQFRDSQGRTRLHQAAFHGLADEVARCIAAGDDLAPWTRPR